MAQQPYPQGIHSRGGHVRTTEERDAALMARLSAFGHRSPAERLEIVGEPEIVWRGQPGIEAYFETGRHYPCSPATQPTA